MRAERARSEARGGAERAMILAAFVLLNGIIGLVCLYAAGAGADLFLQMFGMAAVRPPVEEAAGNAPATDASADAEDGPSAALAFAAAAAVETAGVTGTGGPELAEPALSGAYGGTRAADAPLTPEDAARPDPAASAQPVSPPDASPAPPRRVALTFDDGPDGKYTPKVLDILSQYGVTATFFVVGVQAEQYPDMLARIRDEGHEIGSHGYAHANMGRMTAREAAEDLMLADEAIRKAADVVPTLFRPPYGSVSEELKAAADETGKTIIRWNVDPRDWDGTPAEEIASHVLEHAKDGAVILLHSFGGKHSDLSGTIEALPVIIEELLAQGYELVTVSGLEREDG